MSLYSLCFATKVIETAPDSETIEVSLKWWARPLLPLLIKLSERKWRQYARGRRVAFHPAERFAFPELALAGEDHIRLTVRHTSLFDSVSYEPEETARAI